MYLATKDKSEKHVHFRILSCLIALTFMAFYYYGKRALYVALSAVVTSYLCDVICVRLRHKRPDFLDLSPIISGLTLSLLMPASINYEIVIVASIVMIVVGKQCFGGKDNPIFNHVAVGYVFTVLCFKYQMLSYPTPAPFQQLDISNNYSGQLSNSFTYLVNSVAEPSISSIDQLLGRITGPMGTTHFIVLMVIAFVLIWSKIVSAATFFGIIGVVGGAAYFFDYMGTSKLMSLYFELISGSLIFGALFIACDYNTAPKHRSSRLFYGIITGGLTIAFRRINVLENPILFAVILANPLVGMLERNSYRAVQLFKHLYTNRREIARKLANGIKIGIAATIKFCKLVLTNVYRLIIFVGRKIAKFSVALGKESIIIGKYICVNTIKLLNFIKQKIKKPGDVKPENTDGSDKKDSEGDSDEQ